MKKEKNNLLKISASGVETNLRQRLSFRQLLTLTLVLSVTIIVIATIIAVVLKAYSALLIPLLFPMVKSFTKKTRKHWKSRSP